MTVFIGICKAIYSYEPQTVDELAIQEDDILYLLEKSEVDDWWTVKKRVIGSDAEEPFGLIPSNYVEPADVISKVRALYDYQEVQNPDEELTFNENDIFDVFDDNDPDWLLVYSKTKNEYGFIPGNYVDPLDSTTTAAPATLANPVLAPATVTPIEISALPPPPKHSERAASETPKEQEEMELPLSMPAKTSATDSAEEDVPPTKPARPTSTVPKSGNRQRSRSRVSYYEDDYANYNASNSRSNRDDSQRNDESNYNSNVHTWGVAEVDGRKKRKAKLSIGNNKIFFIPQKGDPQEWSIDNLLSYDNEKKHMFLEFVDPYKSLELHTGNNDTCTEIMGLLGEVKGASRDSGFREVEMATKSKKKGNVILDFQAESNDELSIKQGQVVYILEDQKSKDWWMCELVESGRRGVVPAQFIEPIHEKLTSSSTGGLFRSLKNLGKISKSQSKSQNNNSNSWQDDELDGAQGNRSRSGSQATKRRSNSTSSKKELPNPKKSRIWEDRSGTFKVEAQFIGCKEGKVHLHKVNGVQIAVAADKLSNEDLIYVERVTGFSLDRYREGNGGNSNSEARDNERERRRRLREQDEKERDRRLRERELNELKKARDILDEERSKLHDQGDMPPSKPPRPSAGGNRSRSQSQSNKNNYDWFELFLNCGIDVSNCQRYTSNFDKELITEDMMVDINPSMLRTLGLREGDIVRVIKYLDKKFGREAQQQVPSATGGMFSEADGSLKVNVVQAQPAVAQELLPQTVPASNDNDDWTVKPAAVSESVLSPRKSEFTGSMQDLLDLKPLEPKKAESVPVTTSATPTPNIKDLEPIRAISQPPLTSALTGRAVVTPLDPFKTGGHNVLPISTGFVMMPISTGGVMTLQRTGGVMMPQTTFGAQLTGGLLPIATTGGMMPVTSFGAAPTSTILPLQRTGGLLPIVNTGRTNIIPATSFNLPPSGTILPVQRTANGLMAGNNTGGILPMNTTGGMIPMQMTGGMLPQTTFGTQLTGGMNMMPQTSFGAHMTGGAMNNMMPQVSFGTQMTGGAINNMMPQTSFGGQPMTGGNMMQMQIQGAQGFPNMAQQPMIGGQQPMFGGQQPMFGGQQTGGFQPQSQFGVELQKTGNAMNQLPAFNNSVNNITQGVQNMSMMQQPLQNQPTGFGFGNSPQQPNQANIFNATTNNPFGF